MDNTEERKYSDQVDMTVVDRHAASAVRASEESECNVGAKSGCGSRTVTTLSKIADELQSATPVISNVAVTNSENVHFGNNTYFNGPVVIKQIIQSNSGLDNVAYTKTENEDLGNNAQHATSTKCDPTHTRVFHIKMWHKIVIVLGSLVTVSAACCLALIRSDSDATTHNNFSSSKGTHQVVIDSCNGNHQYVITFTLFVVVSVIILSISYPLNGRRGVGRRIRNTPRDQLKDRRGFAEDLIVAKFHLRWVSRMEWLAEPPTGALDPIRLPVPWVIVTHTATESCYTQSDCVLRTRLIQTFHIESRKWNDIGYNFLVGGDGAIYIGRGWDTVGAHTKGYNKYAIGIAFIGSFNTESPTKPQLDAFEKLLQIGVALRKLDKDYKLLAHRQLWATSSPGDKVFDIIKQWPHFVTNSTRLIETLNTLERT